MIATIEQLKKYTGVNTDDDMMLGMYLDSAAQIVINYLGYSPELETYTDLMDGGTDTLQLAAKPVDDVQQLKVVGGESIDPGEYHINEERIFLTRELPAGRRNIMITYSAGYAPEDIPGVIQMTVLRIAALMQTEADGNIGITSKQFGDTGSRTFIQTTNYDKYLKILSRYRIMRI
ncbi:hypothetical protein [Spirochaeta africana]|uniref:Phage gp6-like head-tail connector protein n=1 Tax=Spirochaeta africana (strain ATCC 700263 / DSM 8902 / Z-7692) TaxID=889378 RepID=H9UJE0_SPIAZ|nr:hypothetical protein [Spirochaeta africana]AFG37633.1 hypothetical protein Spiaf_1574 [Spirochaeta africana DSM 8902]